MGPHQWVIGPRGVDRLRRVTAEYEPDIVARCHRRRRGPYTGVDTVLADLLPVAQASWPELVERHRFALLYGISELEAIIGPTPATLAGESPFEERTRYFGSALIRVVNQGIVSFLIEYARRRDGAPLRLLFDEADQADPTTQEFIAILVRRADPDRLHVSVGSATDAVGTELSGVLLDLAHKVDAVAGAGGYRAPISAGVASATGPAEDLVRRYVASDGTSDEPAEQAAYAAADPALVARLHDERADELEPAAGWGIRTGALVYHREHGSDPTGAGRQAINAAFQRCVEIGFSAAIIDLGERGRAVTDPQVYPRDYANLVNHAASALVADGRTAETEALLADLRQRFTDPKVHMLASYTMAMLHTRFLRPRNHDVALQWQNNAIAIASLLPDPTDRLVYGVFQDNALALIEMHRGNLAHALDLVQAGMTRLDGSLRDDQWLVHRSQLLYNRARLFAALGRLEESIVDFTVLVELDPNYTDYLSERAGAQRRLGNLDAALADYDRAIALAPPFPELYYNRGTARQAVGDLDGALADFTYVLEMEPDDLDSRVCRAELLLNLGRTDAAESDVDIALGLQPDDASSLCLKGTIALERGAAAEALELFDAALERDARYPAALANRAVLRFQSGRAAEAVDDLTAALAITGDDPDLLLNRGIAQAAAGRTELALADFDRALLLPDADRSELLLQRDICLAATAGAA